MDSFDKSEPRKRRVEGWRQAERRASLARRSSSRKPVFVAKAPAKLEGK